MCRKRLVGVDPSLFFTCPSSATPSSTPSKDPSFIISIDDVSVSRNVNNTGQFVCSINSLLIAGNADLSSIAGIICLIGIFFQRIHNFLVALLIEAVRFISSVYNFSQTGEQGRTGILFQNSKSGYCNKKKDQKQS